MKRKAASATIVTRPLPWWRRILRWIMRGIALFIAVTVALVLLLRFVPVPTTAFMIERRVQARLSGQATFALDYRWVPMTRIAPAAALAVVASEDQRFPTHRGFDFDSIASAWSERRAGKRVRGASTISQQVAKNLFLWSGRSWLRKGAEVYFTVLIESCWSKRRILEVYLNVAEFGDGVYGVEAASRRYFNKPAAQLRVDEAARLVTVLPDPKRMKVNGGSRYVRSRSAWVARQMKQLGGPAYLDDVLK